MSTQHTNQDIKNAAKEYADKFGKGEFGLVFRAYQAGAKDLRDNKIYIAPQAKENVFLQDKDNPATSMELL